MAKCYGCQGPVPCANCLRCSGCRRTRDRKEFGNFVTCEECRDRRKNGKSIESVLKSYKSNAARSNRVWNLEDDQAKELLRRHCLYCGHFREGFLNGIDRLENDVGYEEPNCVPACSTCNMLKGDLDVFDFVGSCKRVADYAGVYFSGIKK